MTGPLHCNLTCSNKISLIFAFFFLGGNWLSKILRNIWGAKDILIEGIKLITDWEVAAEEVNNSIDSFSIEDLKAIAVFQEIFVGDLDVLKKTAEDYLNFTKFSATEDENK